MARMNPGGRGLALAACFALAAAGAAGQPAATPPPEAERIPVDEAAPPGSLQQVAIGAAVGVIVGLAVLVLVFSSAD